MENTGVRLWEILDKMLYAIFVRFLHLKFLEKRWDGFMQFVKFGVVGVTNTVISYTLNVLVLFACAKLHIFERYDYIGKYDRIPSECALVFLLEQPLCIRFRGRRETLPVESVVKDIYILWFYGNHIK